MGRGNGIDFTGGLGESRNVMEGKCEERWLELGDVWDLV